MRGEGGRKDTKGAETASAPSAHTEEGCLAPGLVQIQWGHNRGGEMYPKSDVDTRL